METGEQSNMSGLAQGRRTLGFLLRDASRLMRRRRDGQPDPGNTRNHVAHPGE
jgi:hypothetical protein